MKIEVQNHKIIGYEDKGAPGGWRITHAVEYDPEFESFKVIPFLFYFITSKKFRFGVFYTMLYGITHYDSYRGSHSSDVILFQNTKGYYKIWNKKR